MRVIASVNYSGGIWILIKKAMYQRKEVMYEALA